MLCVGPVSTMQALSALDSDRDLHPGTLGPHPDGTSLRSVIPVVWYKPEKAGSTGNTTMIR